MQTMTPITAHAYKQVLCTFEAHVQLHIYSNEHSPAAGGHHHQNTWKSQDGLLLNEHALHSQQTRQSQLQCISLWSIPYINK